MSQSGGADDARSSSFMKSSLSFLVIWTGQLFSRSGSALTAFALGVWVYQKTGSVTKFAFISVCSSLPVVLISPFAGALIDRWDRRRAMILGDAGAGLSILSVLLLLYFDRLELWHIYLATAAGAAFSALQWPAYNASVTLLVPKKHFGRANGMVQLGIAAARISAPLLGGLLLVSVNVNGVVLIDFLTFALAVFTLLITRIPKAPKSNEVEQKAFLKDVSYVWTFLRGQPGLLALMALFGVCNFLIGIVSVLVVPLVLAFTTTVALGTVLSIGGAGMLTSSLLVSAWGGPRRRVLSVCGSLLVVGLCVVLAGVRPLVPLIAAAAFGLFFAFAIVNSSTQTIVQTKVATELQGRVFAALTMIAWAAYPLAYPLAGPLANFFEPLMQPGGRLVGNAGALFGVGAGRGIGLLFVIMGTVLMVASIIAYLYPRLRKMEDELPDVSIPDTTDAERAETDVARAQEVTSGAY